MSWCRKVRRSNSSHPLLYLLISENYTRPITTLNEIPQQKAKIFINRSTRHQVTNGSPPAEMDIWATSIKQTSLTELGQLPIPRYRDQLSTEHNPQESNITSIATRVLKKNFFILLEAFFITHSSNKTKWSFLHKPTF